MKKHSRRLILHRETLRHLQSREMAVAHGAANTHELNTGCACTVGCGTGGGTGGTGGGTATCTREFITTCVC
ncbi:MAG TPA: hypothetical protein VIA62_25020 [Thermoanaerobaculia bacterium]|jgi:hypothetical protein|nr:hypothetical protein [Thermoanaerobaculia bacterium]